MKKKNGIIFLIALIGLFLTACGAKETTEGSSTDSTKAKEVSVTLVLKEDGKEFESKKVNLEPDTSLFTAMKDTYDVQAEDGFITGIAGKAQDSDANKYWTFTVNDKEVNVGAQEVKLKNNDTVVFDLAEMK